VTAAEAAGASPRGPPAVPRAKTRIARGRHPSTYPSCTTTWPRERRAAGSKLIVWAFRALGGLAAFFSIEALALRLQGGRMIHLRSRVAVKTRLLTLRIALSGRRAAVDDDAAGQHGLRNRPEAFTRWWLTARLLAHRSSSRRDVTA